MKKLIPILFLFFACKKNDAPSPANLIYDSVQEQFHKYYRLDVNGDKVPDVKLGWREQPFQLNIKFSYVVALHAKAKIHATQQSIWICRDTSGPVGMQYVLTHNCTGSPNQVRVDTFMATPNLDSVYLYSTAISSAADSVVVYKKTFLWYMPFSPFYNGEEIYYGFFLNTQSGFLLFSVDGKRYALKLKNNTGYMPGIEKLIKVDP